MPETIVSHTFLEGPVHCPRCAEDLEGGQTEPVRLVFHEDLADAQGIGEFRGVYKRRRFVAGQPVVESQG
jgi:hypothetical protein